MNSVAASPAPLLELRRIVKNFPGLRALDGVDFKVFPGTVTALLGENGSGKSTLMKVLTGIYQADAGELRWRGQHVQFNSVAASQAAGIALIHQELNLFPNLSVAENIFFGREHTHGWGQLNRDSMNSAAAELMAQLDVDIRPELRLGELSMGHQQLIEIAKALSLAAQLIIFDEPTTALTHKETQTLFKLISRLKMEGRAIVYISHRLPEIFLLADVITVLRDGKLQGERRLSATTEDELVYLMVGRTIREHYPYSPARPTSVLPVLALEQFSAGPVQPVSFTLAKGELVGIVGIMGSGRTELARAIIGLYGPARGILKINGQNYAITHPRQALRHGICYVSEDRKKDGLFLQLSIVFNIVIASLRSFVTAFIHLRLRQMKTVAQARARALNIKTTHIAQLTQELSGGNQQKVAIARALVTEPQVLIFDEPTRGIDVGAKLEIYKLMNSLKQDGLAILMISSELSEVLALSDRILVMCNHKIVGEFKRNEVSSEKVMKLMLAH